MSKKIFITGGTGFIGRNLKEHFENEHDVYAPISDELDLLDSERVKNYLQENQFDIIIHCATWNATRNSKKDTSKVFENNLRMYFNIARHKDLFNKMIYYGSGAEFSREHWKSKMSEDYFDEHIPSDQYGFSKYIMCKHTEKSRNIYNLRLFGVFGKYEDWQIRFISNAICKVIYDLPIIIKQNVFFDYMYIDDLVKITEWFIYNKPGEQVYNVCTGNVYDLKTLAQIILKVADKKLPLNIKTENVGQEYSGEGIRLCEIYKYEFGKIENQIKTLLDWYIKNKASIGKELLYYNK